MNKIQEWQDKVLNKYYQKNGLESISPEEVKHILDFFNSDEGHSYHSRIIRISVPSAIKLAKDWIAQLSRKGHKEKEGDTSVILTCPDGYTWVEMLTTSALEREGTEMRHCISSYRNSLHRKISRLFSLRDDKNQPHCSVELRKHFEGYYFDTGSTSSDKYRVSQISGKANSTLAEKYVPLLKNFLNYAHNNFSIELENRTYLRHNLIYNNNEVHSFSDLKEFKGNLYLNHSAAIFAPEFTINGDLFLVFFKGTLPKKLTVNGNLTITRPQEQAYSDVEVVVTGTLTHDSKFAVPAHWSCAQIKEKKETTFLTLSSLFAREGMGGQRIHFVEMDTHIHHFQLQGENRRARFAGSPMVFFDEAWGDALFQEFRSRIGVLQPPRNQGKTSTVWEALRGGTLRNPPPAPQREIENAVYLHEGITTLFDHADIEYKSRALKYLKKEFSPDVQGRKLMVDSLAEIKNNFTYQDPSFKSAVINSLTDSREKINTKLVNTNQDNSTINLRPYQQKYLNKRFSHEKN